MDYKELSKMNYNIDCLIETLTLLPEKNISEKNIKKVLSNYAKRIKDSSEVVVKSI